MSVFTNVSESQLQGLLQQYDLGALTHFHGIEAGVTNTNYWVETSGGQYVLTLLEDLNAEDLHFYLDLVDFLSEREIPCPHTCVARDGHRVHSLCDRPAILIEALPGETIQRPNVAQCQAIGDALGRMHCLVADFDPHRESTRGHAWRGTTAALVLPILGEEEHDLLKTELQYLHDLDHRSLPSGIVHADLFCDNALFTGDKLTGIIDFYYACHESFLFDLGVVINDWCVTEAGAIDTPRYEALLAAYRVHRSFTDSEKAAWQGVMRLAATRYWLSRLQDYHFQGAGDIVQVKDPDVFKRVLLSRRAGMIEL